MRLLLSWRGHLACKAIERSRKIIASMSSLHMLPTKTASRLSSCAGIRQQKDARVTMHSTRRLCSTSMRVLGLLQSALWHYFRGVSEPHAAWGDWQTCCWQHSRVMRDVPQKQGTEAWAWQGGQGPGWQARGQAWAHALGFLHGSLHAAQASANGPAILHTQFSP